MGNVKIDDKTTLHYDEYGCGDRVIISAQQSFAPFGVQRSLAERGYHVFCVTLRGFSPSSLTAEDYGENWYDVFAGDVVSFADLMGIDAFFYIGASHGAGLGWHLALSRPERVKAFIAMVPGPHSLDTGTMSFRQMVLQGLIPSPPPMDPPIDSDPAREARRREREEWLQSLPEQDPLEKAIDYGRPLMKYGSEENLRKALGGITTPTLILGSIDDPISTPELMLRTARCLPHCKTVMYSNCGHNIDTDLIEELTEESDRFLRAVSRGGKWYEPLPL